MLMSLFFLTGNDSEPAQNVQRLRPGDSRESPPTDAFVVSPIEKACSRSLFNNGQGRLENIVRRFRCSRSRPAVCISTRSQPNGITRNLLFKASAQTLEKQG